MCSVTGACICRRKPGVLKRTFPIVPINFSLLAASKDENILGKVEKYDRRSIAGKRRAMAQSKGTDVMIQLIDEAMKAGHRAKYVLSIAGFPIRIRLFSLKTKVWTRLPW